MIGCGAAPTPSVKDVEALDLKAAPELGSHAASIDRSASIYWLNLVMELFTAKHAVEAAADGSVKLLPVLVLVDNFEKLEEDRRADAEEEKQKELPTTGIGVFPLLPKTTRHASKVVLI